MTIGKTPIFLVGATGVGKSEVALTLARAHAAFKGAAILAMDAMQVYRGADIGTSKPSAEERMEIPHGGLDLVDFGASFDVAHYLRHAESFLREQREAGRRVIVVGGTGLYFRALTRGLCEAPQGPEALREELGKLSTEELRERLRRIDPAMLERLDTSNPRRLVRAIEVKEATGRSLREWQEETPEPLVREYEAFWLCREKEDLQARIERRVEAMFAAGWVEEVRGLMKRHGAEAVQNFPGIGYREIAEMLKENEGKEEAASCGLRPPGQQVVRATGEETGARSATATDKRPGDHRPPLHSVRGDILVATRQYAKRQLTWFGREPSLRKVMLPSAPSIPADLLSLF